MVEPLPACFIPETYVISIKFNIGVSGQNLGEINFSSNLLYM